MLPHLADSSERAHRAAGPRPWVVTGSAEQGETMGDQRAAGADSRILVVDRDPMSGDLLAASLATHSHLSASAVSATDLLRVLSREDIDVAVISLDLDNHSKSGLDLAQTVSREYPEVRIIVLLNDSNQGSVIDSFRSGARGVFSRENPLVEFIDCVERVHRGFIWAGSKEAGFIIDALKRIPAPAPNEASSMPLTKRELQVVRCAAKGKSNRIIARELGLSEHTVKNYLFRAFEKLGVSNRVELLFYLTLRGQAPGVEMAEEAEEAVAAQSAKFPGT